MSEHNKSFGKETFTADDSAIGTDYIRELIQRQTGRTVKNIRPVQFAGRSADFTTQNKAFFAIDLHFFPLSMDSTNA